MAEEQGIRIIDTRHVVVESMLDIEGVKHIFIGKSPFRQVRRYGLAHELGHALIDQKDIVASVMELEADYFARSLVGPASLTQAFVTVNFRLLTNPLGCLRYLLNFERQYYENLLKMALSKR